MTMDELIRAIESSAVNEWILSSPWAWPIMEILHFFGLSLLLGSILIFDLRLAGFFRQIDIGAAKKLLPLSVLGFGINFVTGSLFFIGDPARYSANIGFLWKMVLVVIAGLNVLLFLWKVAPAMNRWQPHEDTPLAARGIAWLSLGTWVGVLLLGRLIPYVGTG